VTDPCQKHYYIDESGDPVLFSARGKVLVGEEGCSRYFILGMLDVADVESLGVDFARLRKELLADPYFNGVPSMQPQAKKTALHFHAKDDLPEVRREVFKVIQGHAVRFSAVIRDKRVVYEYVHARNQREASYRYHQDELYDHTVRRLFKERLHKHEGYNIRFAIRGNSPRTEALRNALESSRQRFAEGRGLTLLSTLEVKAVYPRDEPALQAADYFLWALQRVYERGEDRYMELMWPQVSLVVDADDTRLAEYGAYYTKKKPLKAAALNRG
jgi:hypothetical protein